MEFKEKDKLLLLYEETTNLIPESNKISKEKIDKVEEKVSQKTIEFKNTYGHPLNILTVENDAINVLKDIIKENRNSKNFGNARFIRNIYEKTIIKHATNTKNKKTRLPSHVSYFFLLS